MRRAGVVIAIILTWPFASLPAATYTVSNTNDSGPGSLRQAILDVNAGSGGDTITFDGSLAGSEIVLASQLPALLRAKTTVDGDLNNDSAPDIAIDGSGTAGALSVTADECIIEGLAIYKGDHPCLTLDGVSCEVYSCHLGVDLTGAAPLGRDAVGIAIYGGLRGGGRHQIGAPGKGNVFAASLSGVAIASSEDNRIEGNHFGVNRAGDAALGHGGSGVGIASDRVSPSRSAHNIVSGNVFGGLDTGVSLSLADRNTIAGNLFGLTADGARNLPIRYAGVSVQDGEGNRIGGTEPGARNVFAGNAQVGVSLRGQDTRANRVWANWFGTDGAGRRQRALRQGVSITEAGPQEIGGADPDMGNYFCPTSRYAETSSVSLYLTAGCLIQNNRFGVLPNGRLAGLTTRHVSLSHAGAALRGNVVARAQTGLECGLDGPLYHRVKVCGNTFRRCETAIDIQDVSDVRMGDLSNGATDDDGGNVFRDSNTWFIVNHTARDFKAEGNTFPSTHQADIDAKILDQVDDATKGRIDFDPLAGGAHPTDEATAAAVAAASAVPTAAGVEIAYTLSGPADVTVRVLNVAGRPVATVARDRAADVGLQRLVWSGRADTGVRVPAGTYLIEIAARSGDGGQSRAAATVRVAPR